MEGRLTKEEAKQLLQEKASEIDGSLMPIQDALLALGLKKAPSEERIINALIRVRNELRKISAE